MTLRHRGFQTNGMKPMSLPLGFSQNKRSGGSGMFGK